MMRRLHQETKTLLTVNPTPGNATASKNKSYLMVDASHLDITRLPKYCVSIYFMAIRPTNVSLLFTKVPV